jgi:hypothetical protein
MYHLHFPPNVNRLVLNYEVLEPGRLYSSTYKLSYLLDLEDRNGKDDGYLKELHFESKGS